jgi:hypothetical protein
MTRRCGVGIAVLLLLMALVVPASARIVIDSDTTIDYEVNERIDIIDGASPPTTVEVREPANIEHDVHIFDSSVLNVRGGRIDTSSSGPALWATDQSTVNIYGGQIDAEYSGILAGGSATVNVFGGDIFEISVSGGATVEVSGGDVRGRLETGAEATARISGGRVEKLHVDVSGGPPGSPFSSAVVSGGTIWGSDGLTVSRQGRALVLGGDISRLAAEHFGRIDVYGGHVGRIDSGSTHIRHSETITIFGAEFNYPYGAIPETSGTLTGRLKNGDPIHAEFVMRDQGSIVLAIPEPSVPALALCFAASMAVVCALRRRHAGKELTKTQRELDCRPSQ